MLDASGLIHVTDNLFLVAEDNQDCLRFFSSGLKRFQRSEFQKHRSEFLFG